MNALWSRHLSKQSFATVLILLLTAVQGALADDPAVAPDADTMQMQPPEEAMLDDNMRVGRLSYLEGTVLVSLAENPDEWIGGGLNGPMIAWDSIYTHSDGRAELQFGEGVHIRVMPNTKLQILALEPGRAQVSLEEGYIATCVASLSTGISYLEVNTPSAAVLMDQPHRALVKVVEPDMTRVWPLSGTVEVSDGNLIVHQVRAGSRCDAKPTGAMPIMVHANVPPPDHDVFAGFQDERGKMIAKGITPPALHEQVVGVEDLEGAGEWLEVEEYGKVWRPTVVEAEWVPYRSGRWVYRYATGWCWVPYEPWGWTTHHYGRWVYVPNYRWCWVPYGCSYTVSYPVWSPAWVGFYYVDRGFSIGLSVGGSPWTGYAWIPLGPRDSYRRGYRHGYRDGWYDGRPPLPDPHTPQSTAATVAVAQPRRLAGMEDYLAPVTEVTGYQNSSAPGAVVVASRSDFVTGRTDQFQTVSLDEKTAPFLRVVRAPSSGPQVESFSFRAPSAQQAGADGAAVEAARTARSAVRRTVQRSEPAPAAPTIEQIVSRSEDAEGAAITTAGRRQPSISSEVSEGGGAPTTAPAPAVSSARRQPSVPSESASEAGTPQTIAPVAPARSAPAPAASTVRRQPPVSSQSTRDAGSAQTIAPAAPAQSAPAASTVRRQPPANTTAPRPGTTMHQHSVSPPGVVPQPRQLQQPRHPVQTRTQIQPPYIGGRVAPPARFPAQRSMPRAPQRQSSGVQIEQFLNTFSSSQRSSSRGAPSAPSGGRAPAVSQPSTSAPAMSAPAGQSSAPAAGNTAGSSDTQSAARRRR